MNSDFGRAVLVKYVVASTSEMVFTLDVFHRFDSVAYTPLSMFVATHYSSK